jgi:hypothetical protein
MDWFSSFLSVGGVSLKEVEAYSAGHLFLFLFFAAKSLVYYDEVI